MEAIDQKGAHPQYARTLASGLVAAGLLVGGAAPAWAQQLPTTIWSKPRHHHHHKLQKSETTVAPAIVVNKDAEPAPIPACSRESAAALNKYYNIKGWIVPPPAFQNSVSQDYDCWRTNLAKYGFSVLAYSNLIQQENMLNHYTPASNLQQYAGQKFNGGDSVQVWLLYDLSRFGVPDGQLQIGGVQGGNTWIKFAPNDLTFGQLSYYQTAFHGALEFNIGWLNLVNQFQGVQVGGNLANVLGPASGIQQEVGGSYNTTITPAAIIRWNITNRFYDKFSVSRSLVPNTVGGLGDSILQEHYSDPLGLAITNRAYIFGVQYPASRELLINEVGYKNAAAPNDPATWVRFDSYYNFSDYEDLQNPGTAADPGQQVHNMAAQIFVDRQIWQSEPGSRDTAYKGLYIGGTAGYASPQANSIYENFGAQAYTYGMFGRPLDQISLIFQHEAFSPYLANAVNNSSTCLLGNECIRHAQNTYELIYNANILHGWYVGVGAAYIDHPSAAWSPNAIPYGSATAPINPQLNINHALNFLASMHINL
jgi:porin